MCLITTSYGCLLIYTRMYYVYCIRLTSPTPKPREVSDQIKRPGVLAQVKVSSRIQFLLDVLPVRFHRVQ